MKATHTAEYFEKYREQLFAKYEKECNFEYHLQISLPDFSQFGQEVREKVEPVMVKMEAQKVADTAKEDLLKKMHMIKEIKAGRASLGYTTRVQEIRAWHDLNEGFEFSCYMLSQFKKKYGIA